MSYSSQSKLGGSLQVFKVLAHPLAACGSIDKFLKILQFVNMKTNDNKAHDISLKQKTDKTISDGHI